MKPTATGVQYCTASLNLSPTHPSTLPLLKMDLETKHKIEATVTQILNSVDLDSVTELDVRTMASQQLNLDLSDLPYKILVRQITESFLLSLPDDPQEDQESDEDVVKRKIEIAVTEILRKGDVYSATLDDVMVRAGDMVGLDVSVLPYSDFVRQAFIAFLKSNKGGGGGVVAEQEEQDVKPVVVAPVVDKPNSDDSCRVICKLSNKREVAIRGSGQKTLVSIRDLFWKDGKQIPSTKSICLSSEQWSIFRKSIPAIEEAIAKVESSIRSDLGRKLADDRHDGSKLEFKQNGGAQGRADLVQEEATRHKPQPVATGKRDKVAAPTVPSAPRGLAPIEIIRFDGKNYQQWAAPMELYLNHLQVAYVLIDPCPSAVGVTDNELGQTLAALEKWTNDDHVCRQCILNSLCDNLYGYYSKKPCTAKNLWEELKLIYLNEEHGSKVSLVKKYMEFQMVEEKPVFEQVEEFHRIADSINASDMYVEERFHVNVILSKLPPSWKPYSIELMKENYLPVWMLMDHLKAEESRRKGNKGEALLPRPNRPVVQPAKKLGPQRIPMKKPGVPPANYEPDRERKVKFCIICKKKGHVPEQCWFRKPGGNELTNDNVKSADIVANANTYEAAL